MTMTQMQWQPIETAPRDGTLIEVHDPDVGGAPMRWNPEGFNPLVSKKPGIWETSDKSLTWCEDDGYGPTMWRPLPPPPETARSEP
jgi:hypothetical protein